MFSPIKKEVISRTDYLKLVEKGQNLFFVGQRNIGKTVFLKELEKKGAVYIDLEKTSISPEMFAKEVIEKISASILNNAQYKDFNFILKNIEKFNENSKKIIKNIENELLKKKPDHKLLVTLALSFASSFNKKLTTCFDEFLEILGLNNYDQIKDIMGIFNSIDKKNVQFILTSSYVNLSKNLQLQDFQIVDFKPFNLNQCESFIKKLIKNIKKEEIKKIFEMSSGIPLYIEALCSRFILAKDVEKAFVIETLSSGGRIYQNCLRVFSDSIAKSKGQTSARVILKILASEKRLRLNQISERIYRISPVTKNLLARLVEVDLISKIDAYYSFSDKVLRYWAKHYFSEEEIDEKMLDELVKELEEEL